MRSKWFSWKWSPPRLSPVLPALVLLLACGSVAAESLLDYIPGRGPDQGAAVVSTGQGPAMLYLNPEHRVVFRRGEQVLAMDESLDISREGGKHLRLYQRPEGLFALWWQKRDDGAKDLYLRRSTDDGASFEPVVKLNTGGGVLPTYLLASDGEGRVAVAYHDERRPRYRIHVNVSQDGGASWLEQDIRLDATEQPFAIEPQLIFHGGHLIATWKEREGQQTRVMSRYSEDGGLSWSPEQELGRFDTHFFTADVLLDAGERALLLGYVPGRGLFGYHTADGGASWAELPPVPGTDRPSVAALSQIDTARLDDQLHLVFSLELHGRDEARRTLNPQVFSARLNLVDLDWHETPLRLDTGKAHNMTSAMNPGLAVTESGLLVASWQDYRDIRPNIYLSWSTDGGEHWTEPRPLLAPGESIAAFPRLSEAGDAVHLVYDRFRDDAYSQRGVYQARVEADNGALAAPEFPAPDEQARRERLEQRVTEFWELRLAERHTEVYDFFDPAMRHRVERDAFVAGQHRLRYHEFELRELIVLDNIAAVVTAVTTEIPRMQIEGEDFEMPPRPDVFGMEWVWIGDDWYVVFEGIGRTRYLRY